jgi:hypothetical protein
MSHSVHGNLRSQRLGVRRHHIANACNTVHHLTGEQQQHCTTPLDRRIHLPDEWQVNDNVTHNDDSDETSICGVDQLSDGSLSVKHSIKNEVATVNT